MKNAIIINDIKGSGKKSDLVAKKGDKVTAEFYCKDFQDNDLLICTRGKDKFITKSINLRMI